MAGLVAKYIRAIYKFYMNSRLFYLKIFYVLVIFSLFQACTWARPKETLYFPLAWEITASTPLKGSEFSDGKVAFYTSPSGQKISFPLKKSVSTGKNQIAFLSQKALKLPQGKYTKIELSVSYKNDKHSKFLAYNYPMNFIINNKKITVLGGVFLESRLNTENSSLTETKLLTLHKSFMDFEDIQKDISGLKPELINRDNFSSPKILRRLTRSRRGEKAYYGAEIKMPCRYQGVVALIFKHDNEPIEYYRELDIAEGRCFIGEATYRGPLTFSLSKGMWTPTGLTQVPRHKLDELGYRRVNREPFRSHYRVEIVKILQNNAYTKDLTNEFQFEVKPHFLYKPFLYIGAFQPLLKLDQETIESARFKRSFAIRDFRRVFGQRQAYNGYTGERIVHDKVLGTISVLFHKVEPVQWEGISLKNAQDSALQNITYCVNKSEQHNPLFEVNGSILIRRDIVNQSEKKHEFKFPNSAETVQDFRNCLVSKFTSTSKSLFGNETILNAQIYGL